MGTVTSQCLPVGPVAVNEALASQVKIKSVLDYPGMEIRLQVFLSECGSSFLGLLRLALCVLLGVLFTCRHFDLS